MKYKYSPPAIVKVIFPEFVWESKSDKVLLTFDDGPNPGSTEIILEELKKQNLKAVFFCVGNNIKKYPELAKDIISNGHEIANHTFNHKNIFRCTNEELYNELDLFNKTAEDIFGITPKYFRPPHGRFDHRIFRYLREFKMTNVMWSLLTYDYRNNIETVKYAVENYIKENSLIVLHDSNKSKDIICDSINYLAEKVNEKGFEFGDPEECLK